MRLYFYTVGQVIRLPACRLMHTIFQKNFYVNISFFILFV